MNLTPCIPMSAYGVTGTNADTMSPAFAAENHPLLHLVPKHNPIYRFRTELRMPVMNFLVAPGGDSLALVGPTGAGKTSVVEQVAVRMRYPVRKISAHSRMEMPELIGQMSLQCDPVTGDQQTVFAHGPLALAMKEGSIFLLDEADVLDPAVMAGLNAVLEGGALVLPENRGEVIMPHPNFRFVITGNTKGQGDETGLYAGTLAQNLASWDRCRVLEVSYMIREEELDVLQATLPQIDATILSTMIDVANEVRKQFIGNPDQELQAGQSGLTVTFSTRTLLRWARIATTYSTAASKQQNFPFACPLAQALREALTNRTDKPMRLVIHTIAKDKFGAAWANDPVVAPGV
ncbi:AAA family ATPase [Pseudomonas oryzihabitans]|uniref:Cobaltochelatase CobS n=1 Tax=Pseudomonas oryzihabitans TaxID=47885 RepID=A0A1G5PH77_9PSED|nr:AAA family ATPase [Pseudomonas psychrotolerans]NMY91878.1 AAA domain-containing protein [Pseudomonas psychrotolerans]NMY91909.1 AAA domain-containing protein [Pseudomonas psychrotolerans]SCZ48844.1 cobaltochelatase CobS [Pseudomonas psychrotolerans]